MLAVVAVLGCGPKSAPGAAPGQVTSVPSGSATEAAAEADTRLATIIAEAEKLMVALPFTVRLNNDPPPRSEPLETAISLLVSGVCPGGKTPYANCNPISASPEVVDQAWRTLGDAHFIAGQLTPSVAAYLHARRSAVVAYKLGWAYYKLDNYAEAIASFDQVAKDPDERRMHREEALMYLAISFTEPWAAGELQGAESLARAIEHYRRHPAPHAIDVLERIGDALTDMVLYTQAAETYRHIIATWPTDPRRPRIERKLDDVRRRRGP